MCDSASGTPGKRIHDYLRSQTLFSKTACYRNRQRWLSSPSSTLSGSGSWDVRAHRLSTRAWRTTSSGHIPNKSSPFAKVVTHLLLLVHAPPAPRARARGQHHRDGQSWSSTAAPYTCRPGWHRQQPRRALSVTSAPFLERHVGTGTPLELRVSWRG